MPALQRVSSSPRDLALLFAETLTPSGMLPEAPRTRRGKSLALYSRSPKAVALARVEYLPIQQCGRSLLAFYVASARGARARSWWKDENIAGHLPRSGGGSYSIHHVRRWRRVLEDVGLVRSTYLRPGERLPGDEHPDEDDGYETTTGQTVVEVNMDALLGRGPLWRGPLRGLGWQDAREAREAAEELREDVAAEAERAPAAAPPAAPETAGEGDHERTPPGDHRRTPLTDPGSPTENNHDPARAQSASPRALTGATRPADAGNPGGEGESPPAPIAPRGAPQAASETPRAAEDTRPMREHAGGATTRESEKHEGKEQNRDRDDGGAPPPDLLEWMAPDAREAVARMLFGRDVYRRQGDRSRR